MSRLGFLLLALFGLSAPATAQSRFEIGAGVTWTGGFGAGGQNALLSRGTPATPLTLFETSPRVDAAVGLTARAAYFFTTRIGAEATIDYSRPVLRVAIANDFEQASGSEAVNRLSSYLAGGSLLYRFGGRRLAPFVLGGAAYLRQLDQDNVMLVSASELHAGGGVTYVPAAHMALRADLVVSSRSRSIAFEEKRRTLPVISASLAYRF